MYRRCFISSLICTVVCFVIWMSTKWIYSEETYQSMMIMESPPKEDNSHLHVRNTGDIPNMYVFCRAFSGKRDIFETILVPSLKIFWWIALNIVVVLDNESTEDHKWAEHLESNFPYPSVKFEDAAPRIYHGDGHLRQQWTMFYADKYVEPDVEYVGFVDTDTLFITGVTHQLLYNDNKPVVIGIIGTTQNMKWEKAALTTQKWFKHKEVMRCMIYFPVVIKVKHLVELRTWTEKTHNISFDEYFEFATRTSFSQFNIMCNYVWLYHRDEYAWHIQERPNDKWTKTAAGRVGREYYEKNLSPTELLPWPRVSMHYFYAMPVPPKKKDLNKKWTIKFLTEGFCYSYGFQHCPKRCLSFNQTRVHDRLFLFAMNDWRWHPQCLIIQNEHYKNVTKALKNNRFALTTMKKTCKNSTLF